MNNMQSLAARIATGIGPGNTFRLNEAYAIEPGKPTTTIRGRIYENLGKLFRRKAHGIYQVLHNDATCLVVQGDGRDLSFIPTEGIDCIVTHHPWQDGKSNKGGNRNFANYQTFQYIYQDFLEKTRVLRPGHFCVEILPERNANNRQYLNRIINMAEAAGLNLFAIVPWEKQGFACNTGRKAGYGEDVYLFTKGKTRALRPDAKKNKADPGGDHRMSGAKGMLPSIFKVPPVPRSKKVHQSELPVALLTQILDFTTLPGECVLDQFAGSGTLGEAALKASRECILVEIAAECIETIKTRFKNLGFAPHCIPSYA